jgi:hypothetical protein
LIVEELETAVLNELHLGRQLRSHTTNRTKAIIAIILLRRFPFAKVVPRKIEARKRSRFSPALKKSTDFMVHFCNAAGSTAFAGAGAHSGFRIRFSVGIARTNDTFTIGL